MPNWDSNLVSIDASIEDVDAYITRDDEDKPRFNMHKIYPEKFKASDPCGFDGWNYDWAVKHTGSRGSARLFAQIIHWMICHCVNRSKLPELWFYDAGCERWLSYDTAWSPNNLLLLRLSEITSWRISNIFEEPGMAFEGEFICEAGRIVKDEIGEYRPPCEICDTKYPADQIMRDDESDLYVCESCMKPIAESAQTKPEQ